MSRIAVFPIDAIGHLKSLLTAIMPLADDGRFDALMGFGRAFVGPAFRQAGFDFSPTMMDPRPADHGNDLRWKSFVRPTRDMAETMKAVLRFAPDVILYDCFSVYGRIAAAVTGKPSAAFVTMYGYGTLPEDFVRANSWERDDVQQANATFRGDFDVDLQAEGGLPVLFPSRDQTLVHAPAKLLNPLNPDRQPLLKGALKNSAPETPIGRDVDWKGVVPRTADGSSGCDEALLARVEKAKADGASIVLFSLGTVISDFRYDTPVGGAPSGSAFLQRMLNGLFEAVEQDPRLFLVAAVGPRYLKSGHSHHPKNAVVLETVPQAELLRRYVDVFITHHGANSQAEAMLSGVGMVSLPGAGDQIANARSAIANGVAVADWDLQDPFGTCSSSRLAAAIRQVLNDESIKCACRRLRDEIGLLHSEVPLGDRLLALSRQPM